jgi:hypothetical protein
MTGWWLTYPSEKNDFVSWDYSQYLESHKIPWFQTTNQMMIDQLIRGVSHLV